MDSDSSLTAEARESSSIGDLGEALWECCQCELAGDPGTPMALSNQTCHNGHLRCDTCSVKRVGIPERQNASDNAVARSIEDGTEDDEALLRHRPTAPSSRIRSASCPPMFGDRETSLPQPSTSPQVSWDDSAFAEKRHVAPSEEHYQIQNAQQMGVLIRRAANLNVVDDWASDISCSDASYTVGSDSEDELQTTPFLTLSDTFRS
jgi:hypothetical protein